MTFKKSTWDIYSVRAVHPFFASGGAFFVLPHSSNPSVIPLSRAVSFLT